MSKLVRVVVFEFYIGKVFEGLPHFLLPMYQDSHPSARHLKINIKEVNRMRENG